MINEMKKKMSSRGYSSSLFVILSCSCARFGFKITYREIKKRVPTSGRILTIHLALNYNYPIIIPSNSNSLVKI